METGHKRGIHIRIKSRLVLISMGIQVFLDSGYLLGCVFFGVRLVGKDSASYGGRNPYRILSQQKRHKK